MTMTRQQPPTEADLRRRLAASDEVRVRDTRSGYVGTLYRVATGYVVALTANNSAYTISMARLEVIDDEGDIGQPEAVARGVRGPGEIVAAQPLSNEVRCPIDRFGPEVRWRMPSGSVRPVGQPESTP
ncbi:hypothetical protein B4N89_14020 [Embleya scabrispora]|uniref:Uncharacterized protein n=2 Tax=Embleya scabrispora TaxID=159449 RepID=A0A1T3NYR7_9ACTN|nr:hypothetical protein B4N89_14020 [Embleya scabrispora]